MGACGGEDRVGSLDVPNIAQVHVVRPSRESIHDRYEHIEPFLDDSSRGWMEDERSDVWLQ